MRCCTIALTTLRHSKSIFRTTMRWRALEVVPDVSGRRTNGSRSLARWSNSGTGCFSSQILTTFLDLAPAATIIFVLRDNSTLWFGTSPTRVDFKAREFLFSWKWGLALSKYLNFSLDELLDPQWFCLVPFLHFPLWRLLHGGFNFWGQLLLIIYCVMPW